MVKNYYPRRNQRGGYSLQGAVREGVRRSRLKDVQVAGSVISGIKVNMVNDIALDSASDFAVLPFPPASARTVSKSVAFLVERPVSLIRLFVGWVSDRLRLCEIGHWRYCSVSSAPDSLPGRQPAHLGIIGIQRVAMLTQHLVMPHTKLFRDNRPIAMRAGAANHPASPSIFWGSFFSFSFVVHQAVSVCRVLAPTPCYSALPVQFFSCHNYSLLSITYKALGNSMAVPVIRWIGLRILAALSKT